MNGFGGERGVERVAQALVAARGGKGWVGGSFYRIAQLSNSIDEWFWLGDLW